jgi:hypothetical protein
VLVSELAEVAAGAAIVLVACAFFAGSVLLAPHTLTGRDPLPEEARR